MGVLLVRGTGAGDWNKTVGCFTTTACVVAYFRRFRFGIRQRRALAIRSRMGSDARPLGLRRLQPPPALATKAAHPRPARRVCPRTREPVYRKKVRSVCWEVAIGQSAPWKAAWRWAR